MKLKALYEAAKPKLVISNYRGDMIFHFSGMDKSLDGLHAQVHNMQNIEWYISMIQTGKYEGTGYGRKLMEAIIEEAKRRNIQRITLHTSLGNKEFFEIFGFIDNGGLDGDGLYPMVLEL